jgi:hypothetical protein
MGNWHGHGNGHQSRSRDVGHALGSRRPLLAALKEGLIAVVTVGLLIPEMIGQAVVTGGGELSNCAGATPWALDSRAGSRDSLVTLTDLGRGGCWLLLCSAVLSSLQPCLSHTSYIAILVRPSSSLR